MEKRTRRAAPDPLVGSVLHERYRVLRRIGRGGMGVVYLAEHVLIGRRYAIKTLTEHEDAADERIARFHREAVAAAAVGNEHVVEVTDMGRLEDGSYFLVMEFLEGAELAEIVAAQGRLAPGRAVCIARQLCAALTAVHDKGIVHRDLKPENLFLIEHRGQSDFLKVLDFGVCKLLSAPSGQREGEDPVLTRTNASLGTPQYMAPEQFQASARADHRADLHAVGAILYYMLTGRAPFDAPTLPQLFMRICVEPPPSLLALRPELPAGLAAVIERVLRKHPEERFPSASALMEALAPYVALPDQIDTATSTLRSSVLGEPRPLRATTKPAVDVEARDTGDRGAVDAASIALPMRSLVRSGWMAGAFAALLSLMAWGAWARERHVAEQRAGAAPTHTSEHEVQGTKAPPISLPPEDVGAALAPAPRSSAEAGSHADAGGHSDTRKSRGARARAPLEGQASTPRVAAPTEVSVSEELLPSGVEPSPSKLEDAVQTQPSQAPYSFPRRGLKDVF